MDVAQAVLASPYTVGVKLGGLAIAEFVNKTLAIAFAEFATVGKSCGLSERTVRHAYDVLSKDGYFKKVRRRVRGPLEIQLALPEPGVTGTRMTGRAKPKPARGCPSKRHGDAKVGGMTMTVSTEPSTEPTNEPSTRDASLGEVKAVETGNFGTDGDHLPGISYAGKIEPPRESGWYRGLAHDPDSGRDPLFSIFMVGSTTLKIPDVCSHIGGAPVQDWFLRQIPAATVTALRERCLAGTLTRRAVQMAVVALQISSLPGSQS